MLPVIIGKLLSKNNFAISIILISHWQLLSSHYQIRRRYVAAKHMYVNVNVYVIGHSPLGLFRTNVNK